MFASTVCCLRGDSGASVLVPTLVHGSDVLRLPNTALLRLAHVRVPVYDSEPGGIPGNEQTALWTGPYRPRGTEGLVSMPRCYRIPPCMVIYLV